MLTDSSDPSSGPALVFLCDLIKFSAADEALQIAAVIKLWQSYENSSFRRQYDHKIRSVSTGDGLYAVCWLTDPWALQAMLDMARAIIDEVSEMYAPGMCAALHFGPVAEVPVDGQRMVLCGSGMNDASRLIRYAGRKQIVMSDRWIEWWRTQEPRLSVACRPPLYVRESYQILSKHGMHFGLRLLGDSDPSPALALEAFMEHQVTRALGECVQVVEDWVAAQGVRRRDACVRSTLLAEGLYDDAPHLLPTRFRVSRCSRAPLGQGTTRYKISPPEGPAKALADGAPILLAGLPVYKADPEKYVRIVSSRLKVPPDIVHRWQRKSRCVIATPIPAWHDQRTDSVLCVDMEKPFSEVGPKAWDDLIARLGELVFGRLGPLWYGMRER